MSTGSDRTTLLQWKALSPRTSRDIGTAQKVRNAQAILYDPTGLTLTRVVPIAKQNTWEIEGASLMKTGQDKYYAGFIRIECLSDSSNYCDIICII